MSNVISPVVHQWNWVPKSRSERLATIADNMAKLQEDIKALRVEFVALQATYNRVFSEAVDEV